MFQQCQRKLMSLAGIYASTLSPTSKKELNQVVPSLKVEPPDPIVLKRPIKSLSRLKSRPGFYCLTQIFISLENFPLKLLPQSCT